ncbi:MAG: serine hydrolase domain-containing protein, partial [Gemmatimonadota bacterium]
MRHRALAGSLLAITAAGTLACSKPASSAPPEPDVQAALQSLVDSLVAQNKDVPGAALHVEAPRLKLSWTGVAGYSDPKIKAPLAPTATFRMASNTKTYTAAAILRLWEQGKLGLDDPMSKHLPPELVKLVKGGKYAAEQITIRHLLSHSSGLYDWGTDSAYGAKTVVLAHLVP